MTDVKLSDVLKLDIYDLLGVPPDADEKFIVKSFRKKALVCHPDKNPNNPRAAAEFHKLTQALEVLTDSVKRAAYDKVIKAREATKQRNRLLDSRRKRFKDDLEAREARHVIQKDEDEKAAHNLEQEINRLRKEASRLVEEELANLEKKVKEERLGRCSPDEGLCPAGRLRVKWKSRADDGTYTSESLTRIFGQHGEVSCVVLSVKKRGTALVEFSSVRHPEKVLEETGISESPLSSSWLIAPSVTPVMVGQRTVSNPTQHSVDLAEASQPVATARDLEDLESSVFANLRAAKARHT